MGYFQTACYQVTVQNMSSNLCCVTRGRIRRMHWWHVLGDPVLVSAPKDMQVPVHFTIQNSGDAPVVLNYRLDGVLEDGGGSSQVISLNGLPPGEPVFGQLSIPPQSEGSVDVATLLLQLQPMTVDEVVLSADVDGDGTPERLASVGLVSVAEQGTSDAPIPPAGESGALGASLHASPNPFAHQTTIRFSVPSSESAVRVEVFDVAGRSVRRVLNGPVSAGMHNVVWDGLDEQGHAVNAGIYFVRVRSEGGSLMTRVVRLQ